MRKFLTAMCAVLMAAQSVEAQQVKYTVKGVSKENGKTIYLEDKLTGKVVDRTLVAKGKFAFKGISSPSFTSSTATATPFIVRLSPQREHR